MSRGAVAGGEDFSRDNERSGIGAKVLEELGDGEQGYKEHGRLVVDGRVGEAEDAEEDAGHDKAKDLDLDAAQALDREDRDPVTRDRTKKNNNDLFFNFCTM